MNEWKEFDNIKTPEHWKNINLEKKQYHLHFSFVISLMIMFITFSSVIAYHDELKQWIYNYFNQEDVIQIDNVYHLKKEDINFVDSEYGPFAYEYKMKNDKEIITQVYLIKDYQFQKIDSQSMNVDYENQHLFFEYVIDENRIFAYNFCDEILQVLPVIIDNNIYIALSNQNIIALNTETKEIHNITDDYQSVNPIMSPEGNYILINKSDKYWTVYDTLNQNERMVEGISRYAHSNDIYFIDDDTVFAYSDKTYLDEYKCEHTIMNQINLKTLEIQELDYETDFARIIQIDKDDNNIIIKNMITNKTYTLENCPKNMLFCIGEKYVLFYNSYIYYLYNIEDNTSVKIELPEVISNITDIFVFDNREELLICSDENFYFIDISDGLKKH